MREDSITPINVTGMKFYDVKEISVNEWHVLSDGRGKPEQVHLMIEVEEIPYPFILRFKSRRAVDELVMGLITHANNVWPRDVSK